MAVKPAEKMKNNTSDGKIIKGIAGFYYVYVNGRGVVECKAKGLFRKQGVKPLVGDMVRLDAESGSITELLARKNSLIRPAVANIDQVLLVFAVKDPEPHLNLLDRFLVNMSKQGIRVIIVFNKTDLTEESDTALLRQIYEKAHYKVLTITAGKGEGREEVMELLAGKTTVLAGPSGVGKSTLMNLIEPDAGMETGSLSEKIKRGKNTTRHTELIHIAEDSYLLDTPGFSSLYIDSIEALELQDYYPEIKEHADSCRFAGCSHIKEPDCSVKKAVESGLIAKERYENYCRLYEEAATRKKY